MRSKEALPKPAETTDMHGPHMLSTPGTSDAAQDDSSSFTGESLGLSRVHSNPLFTEDCGDTQAPACSMSRGLVLHGAMRGLP